MHPERIESGRRFGVFLLLALALAPALVTPAAAAKFRHAHWQRVEIYTSDTTDNAQRFLYELLEIRRQMQQLVAPVPLPEPRMQILVFARQKDFEEFQPEKSVLNDDRTTISGFFSGDYGLVMSTAKDGVSYDFGRASIRYFYASYLLQSALPDAPLWVKAGVPEFFAGTECRGKKMYLGDDFMEHIGNIRPSKLLPLAKLMDDDAMQPNYGAARHDNVLYHESWALWHQWLGSSNPVRRQQVKRLFAAIRAGEKGDLATVAKAFGESVEAIEAARRPPLAPKGFKSIESNADAVALAPGLALLPATELDGRFAQAMLKGGTGKGPGSIGYALLQLDREDPPSPRVPEGRAMLATGEKDFEAAREHWSRARERGTDNPYAYLLPSKEAFGNRAVPLNLRPQLPEGLCTTWRQDLDRCVELDPGCVDAYYYRIVLESLAPQPDAVALDRAERSGALEVRPLGYLYLAVARWRLGRYEDAHRHIAFLQNYSRLVAGAKSTLAALDKQMLQEEAKKP